MKRHAWSIPYILPGLVVLLALAGCAREQDADGPGVARPAAVIAPESQRVVEEYLRAASQTSGAEMYALIAASERDDETPESLKDTAHDRYSPATTWSVLKTEEKENAAEVIVEFQGAKVDPNPYRFTLTREAGEWRIVQSPELHEDDSDGIEIKL
jgi:hypothetical protein